MQLILTPATGGQPIIIGIGSATQQGALNLAEITTTALSTDLILIARGGVLMAQTFGNLASNAGTAAAEAAVAAVAADLSDITTALAGVANNVALAQSAEIVGGSITGGNGIVLATEGGGEIALTGNVTVDFQAGTATALPVGSQPTVELSDVDGAYQISFGIPQTLGPVSYQGTISGLWNAATNTPALGPSGAGGTANQVLIVSTPGTQSITGTAAAYGVGDFVSNIGGTAWIHQVNIGSPAALTTLTLGGNVTMLDDGSGQPGEAWTDSIGGVIAQIDGNGLSVYELNANVATVGALTAAELTAPLPTQTDSNGNTLLATGPMALVLGGALLSFSNEFEIANLLGQSGLIFDGANLYIAGNVISSQGTLGSETNSNTFSAQDIANFDAQNLAHSAAVAGRGNTTAQRGVAQYNIQAVIGQSRVVGTQGSPPLSTAQLLDVLQLGQATRGEFKVSTDSSYATFTAQGDNYFHPCVAVCQANDDPALVPVRTGFLANVQDVTVVAGSNNGTISWPSQSGINAASIFEAGDGFQCEGFTVATGNNASISNANTFTVASATATQITTHEVPQATVAPENGITIAQANFGGYGEDPSIVANTEFRLQQLNQRAVLADPTRLNVVTVPGIAYPVAAQCPTANGVTPNPYLYNRIHGALVQAQATAAAGGNGYPAGASLLNTIYVAAGGDESGSGIPTSLFRAQLDLWLKSVVADAYTIFGAAQLFPPFQYSFVVGGGQLSDGKIPNTYTLGHSYGQFSYVTSAGNIYMCGAAITTAATAPTGTGSNIPDGTGFWVFIEATPAVPDPCPVNMATLELMGCSPPTGYPFNYAGIDPNRYIIGPEYAGPDRGDHGTNNGYVWTGCQIAKVRTRVELLGQGWMPCHVLGVYARGQEILVCCNVPEPPLQVQSPFYYDQSLTWADLGFSASDKNGSFTPNSVALAGQTCILIQAGRTVDAPSLLLRYADAANHTGMGMICDSDPWKPALTKYSFTLGSGALLSDNFPNAPAQGGPTVQNGQPFPLWNWLCPGAWPGVAF